MEYTAIALQQRPDVRGQVLLAFHMVAKLPNSDSRPPDRALLASLITYATQLLRPWITWVLRYGPIPQHMAFIMDGNRRFASRLNKASTAGHEFGYLKVNP